MNIPPGRLVSTMALFNIDIRPLSIQELSDKPEIGALVLPSSTVRPFKTLSFIFEFSAFLLRMLANLTILACGLLALIPKSFSILFLPNSVIALCAPLKLSITSCPE